MKVTWKPTGSYSEYPLADDSLAAGAGSMKCLDYWPEHTQVIQTVPRVRGNTVEHFARLNLSVAYTFVVRCQFASIAACAAFRDDIMTNLKGKGNLVLNYDGLIQRTLNNAVLAAPPDFNPRMGISVIVTYRFVGESLT